MAARKSRKRVVHRLVGLLAPQQDRAASYQGSAGDTVCSEELAPLALAVARLGTWTWNPRTGEARLDERAQEIAGLAASDITLEEVRRRVHAEDLAAVDAAMAGALDPAGSGVYAAEFRFQHGDGKVRWVIARGQVQFEPAGGPPARMLGTVLDITERKRAEEASHESEERFRIMADSSPLIIWVTDASANLQFVNRAYREFFGVSEEDVHGRGWQSLVHPDDFDRYVAGFLRAMQERSPFDGRVRVRSADGSWRWLHSYSAPRFSPTGEFLGAVGSSPDVTELVEAEIAARDAARRKDEFLATLAHELRNPLAPIRQAAAITRQPNVTEEQRKWSNEVIDRQVRHMARMLDDLLDVSRISRGQLELRREKTSLQQVIEAGVETARPLIDAHCHELSVDLSGAPAHADVDPVRMAQVIANLLANAAKFTQSGGRIHVSAREEAGLLVLRVRDNGIGLEPDSLNRIFEMFSQVRSAVDRAEEGLGIGLALVRGITELHGGSVTAFSEGPGRGSEFVVRLPMVGADAQPAHRADAIAPRSQERVRILIADDNRDAAATLGILLQLQGHEVVLAHDGLQALDAALNMRPQVALLDIGMPRLNGYELARRIREQPWGSGVTLVAVTGWGQEEDRRQSTLAGFDLHLTKPLDPATLDSLVAQLARRAQPARG